MINKEAIEQIQSAQALSEALAGMHRPTQQHLAALHKDQALLDLEQYMPNRRRARAAVTTNIIDSFAQYVDQHREPGSSIFIASQKMQAIAVLNLGTPQEPGQADNTAALILQQTAAYSALLTATAQPLSQQQAAEFFEDWQPNIECWQSHESTPEQAAEAPEDEATPVKPRIAIAALRSLTIEQARKDNSTVGHLAASGGSFASIAAKSAHAIPTLIHFKNQPYQGLPERIFAIRLGIKTGDAKPTIKLSIIRREAHEQEMALEFEHILRAHKQLEITPIIVGEYHRSK